MSPHKSAAHSMCTIDMSASKEIKGNCLSVKNISVRIFNKGSLLKKFKGGLPLSYNLTITILQFHLAEAFIPSDVRTVR